MMTSVRLVAGLHRSAFPEAVLFDRVHGKPYGHGQDRPGERDLL